jgi:hypothetical protein
MDVMMMEVVSGNLPNVQIRVRRSLVAAPVRPSFENIIDLLLKTKDLQ